jgi:hypothetical protein
LCKLGGLVSSASTVNRWFPKLALKSRVTSASAGWKIRQIDTTISFFDLKTQRFTGISYR